MTKENTLLTDGHTIATKAVWYQSWRATATPFCKDTNWKEDLQLRPATKEEIAEYYMGVKS